MPFGHRAQNPAGEGNILALRTHVQRIRCGNLEGCYQTCSERRAPVTGLSECHSFAHSGQGESVTSTTPQLQTLDKSADLLSLGPLLNTHSSQPTQEEPPGLPSGREEGRKELEPNNRLVSQHRAFSQVEHESWLQSHCRQWAHVGHLCPAQEGGTEENGRSWSLSMLL